MVHLSKPGHDTGHFNTSEVRVKVNNQSSKATSRIIALPKGHYKQPPNLAAGFSCLDISSEAPIRANLLADQITKDDFRISIETWGDSVLYEGGATWIEHKANAKDAIFGQYDTDEGHHDSQSGQMRNRSPRKQARSAPEHRQKNSRPIFFPHAFQEPPEVICWLNRLDLASGADFDYRIRAFADEITAESFLAHLNTWDSGRMQGAAMAWVAFPRGKKNVDCGTFSTTSVRKKSDPRPRTTGTVKFRQIFQKVPTVLSALSSIDAAGNADLRVKVTIGDVTREGFRWTLETWDDSTLYAASASWIALGFD